MQQASILFYCFITLLTSLLFSCKSSEEIEWTGETQGTSYMVKYWGNEAENYRYEVDSILEVMDRSMSTYRDDALIIRFNKADSGTSIIVDSHFLNVLKVSLEIMEETEGSFTPFVLPLVEYWGFGRFANDAGFKPDSAKIDSLLLLISSPKLEIVADTVRKETNNIRLDFNAIAQGYTVDVLAEFLEARRVANYLIEIGGEVRAAGKKLNGETWKVGVDQPIDVEERKREVREVVELNNRSIATSGNYRKYYIKDGQKYSHSIDPKSGYPVLHNLISATVIADECIIADAYATAFMVMGLNKTQYFIENSDKDIEAYLIYSDQSGNWKTWKTKGFILN